MPAPQTSFVHDASPPIGRVVGKAVRFFCEVGSDATAHEIVDCLLPDSLDVSTGTKNNRIPVDGFIGDEHARSAGALNVNASVTRCKGYGH